VRQTLSDLSSSHGDSTLCSSRHVYRQAGPAEAQTQTPCNLIGRRLCCRPAVFFRHLRLAALALRHMKICRVSKMLRVYFLHFLQKITFDIALLEISRTPVGVCVCVRARARVCVCVCVCVPYSVAACHVALV
jgi:hypothetical protein